MPLHPSVQVCTHVKVTDSTLPKVWFTDCRYSRLALNRAVEESHVRFSRILAVSAVMICTGCGATLTKAPVASSRAYNGTASVGDFLKITLDSTSHILTYINVSNGDYEAVPYTVNSDGTYTLSDPAGNLVAAYEVPGYALLIQAAKTGPTHDAPALVTAVDRGQISMSTFAGHAYNYMQFRTAAGGIEVGSVAINASGVGTNSSYWPYGALNQQNQGGSPFNSGTIDMAQAQLDVSGTFLTVADSGGTFDYVFGTANGIFAVDTANGAILGLKKAASKDFDPSYAGTYKAIYYQKTGASTGVGNVETGTGTLAHATLVVSGLGNVIVSDPQGNTIVQAALTPVADTSYLYGSVGQLNDPCYGIFTFRVDTASSQQDVFVTFMDKAMLFSSFTTPLPYSPGGTYNYLYGVALK